MLRRGVPPRVALAALAALSTNGCFGAPRYAGPKSAHFDGERFHNLAHFEQPTLGDVITWQTSGGSTPWPDWVDPPASCTPPARVTRGLRITFINHATTLIQLAGLNVLTDPVWSYRVGPLPLVGPRRHQPPGVAFERLPRIDVVLISHNHYDHLDIPTLERLAERDRPLMLAGLGTKALLAEHGLDHAADLDWWGTRRVGAVSIGFAPAQHWSTRSLADRDGNLWGSFFLRSSDASVYFAGDTGDGPHFELIRRRWGAPDVALLPIGAYKPRWFMRAQHLDPNEAVDALVRLGARYGIAIHWGTFDQSDEGLRDPPRELALSRRSRGLPDDAFNVLENGQSLSFARGSDPRRH